MSSVGFFHDVTSCLPEILFYCSIFKFNENTHIAYEPLLGTGILRFRSFYLSSLLQFSFLMSVGKTYSFAIFGLCVSLCELQMCMAYVLAYSLFFKFFFTLSNVEIAGKYLYNNSLFILSFLSNNTFGSNCIV